MKDFTLENPSSLPLLVQVVPLSLYPNPLNIINVLKEKYGADFSDLNFINDSGAFSLEDLEENNVKIFSYCFFNLHYEFFIISLSLLLPLFMNL